MANIRRSSRGARSFRPSFHEAGIINGSGHRQLVPLRHHSGCGIVAALCHLEFMRTGFPSPRRLIGAGGVVVFTLLFASPGYSAAAPGRAAVGRACGPHAAVRKSIRRPKSFGGPVALPSPRMLAGLRDATAVLKRATRANLFDDDEAIQNDAPAAHVDLTDRQAPMLRPLGVLHRPFHRLLRTFAFSPRSPRGPPVPA